MSANDPDDSLLPTRRSLLSRLKNWEDQEGWREFFDLYWGLIYSVARKAGLSEAEAQDVTQETLITLAKQLPHFRYDPARGTFKSWLHTVIRGRLGRHWRRRNVPGEALVLGDEDGTGLNPAENIPDPAAACVDAIWQGEWEHNLLQAALRRVQAKASARHYQIFCLAALKEVPVSTVARTLGVNAAQVYLARHRVGRMLKEELVRLKRQAGDDGN